MNFFEGIRFRADRKPFNPNGIELYIYDIRDKITGFCQRLEMTTIKEGEAVNNPTCFISNASAQELMDELWQVGLRPSEGTGSAGSLKKTENHLEDMRKIAFQLLNQLSAGGGK